MNFFLPIIAAVLQAGSYTLDKVVLSVKKVTYKTYTGVSFPLIFLITLVIFLVVRPPLSWSLFAGKNLWYLIFTVSATLVANLIFYRALDEDNLGEIQTIELLAGIPTVIFAGLAFPSERNVPIIALALVSSLAVVWSHWKNHRFKIAKHTLPLLIWTIVIAPFGALIIKDILRVWNPITLQLFRSGCIALILVPLYFKTIEKVSLRAFTLLVATNILTTLAWIIYYFSFQLSGIVYTVLIFSLQPFLVYFASVFLLKEKLNWKKFAAFVIILLSIAASQLILGK